MPRKSKAEKLAASVDATAAKLNLQPGTRSDAPAPATAGAGARNRPDNANMRRLHPSLIDPDPEQPREDFDDEEIDALKRSMAENGQLENIVVFQKDAGRFGLIFGERRWRAATKLVLEQPDFRLWCKVEPKEPDADTRLAMQTVENVCRKDFKPSERQAAFRALIEKHGWTAAKVAEYVGLHESTVSRILAVEARCGKDVKAAIDAGTVSETDAYDVARIKDEAERREMEQRLISGNATSEDVRTAAAQKPRSKAGRPTKKKPTSKKPFSEIMSVPGNLRITIACERSRKSPGDGALLAGLQAAVEIIHKRLDAA